MKHKILITGASGAFGSLTCKQLAENGHQVFQNMTSEAADLKLFQLLKDCMQKL